MVEEKGVKIITENRKARHEYHLLEFLEVGLSLQGTEVKSLRNNRANLQDAYCKIDDGELWLYNAHISPYDFGNRANHDPRRPRRLLAHKNEIRRLYAKVREKGYTLIPVRMYFSHGKAKLEIALAQGKKLFDKRQDLAAKTARREVERSLKERSRYVG